MARSGEIKAFTGINEPYEELLSPDIICYTPEDGVKESIAKVAAELERLDYIPPKPQIEYAI